MSCVVSVLNIWRVTVTNHHKKKKVKFCDSSRAMRMDCFVTNQIAVVQEWFGAITKVFCYSYAISPWQGTPSTFLMFVIPGKPFYETDPHQTPVKFTTCLCRIEWASGVVQCVCYRLRLSQSDPIEYFIQPTLLKAQCMTLKACKGVENALVCFVFGLSH